MTKLTFQSITEVPANAKITEEKTFEFNSVKLQIATCMVGVKMEALMISVSEKDHTVRVISNGYIGKAQIRKIHSIYDAAEGDLLDVIRAIYGVGIPVIFWTEAKAMIWSVYNTGKVISDTDVTGRYVLPKVDDSIDEELVKKVYRRSIEDGQASGSIVRVVAELAQRPGPVMTVSDIEALFYHVTDLYIKNVFVRFVPSLGQKDSILTETSEFDTDFIIPTTVDALFEDKGEKYKGFNDSGKGFSRSIPPRRDENGVTMDKQKKLGLKTEKELTLDETLALGVLEKLYGTDAATALIKGRELSHIGSTEGHFLDKGDYIVAEVLVVIEIAK